MFCPIRSAQQRPQETAADQALTFPERAVQRSTLLTPPLIYGLMPLLWCQALRENLDPMLGHGLLLKNRAPKLLKDCLLLRVGRLPVRISEIAGRRRGGFSSCFQSVGRSIRRVKFVEHRMCLTVSARQCTGPACAFRPNGPCAETPDATLRLASAKQIRISGCGSDKF
jgi:hypothetical protein